MEHLKASEIVTAVLAVIAIAISLWAVRAANRSAQAAEDALEHTRNQDALTTQTEVHSVAHMVVAAHETLKANVTSLSAEQRAYATFNNMRGGSRLKLDEDRIAKMVQSTTRHREQAQCFVDADSKLENFPLHELHRILKILNADLIELQVRNADVADQLAMYRNLNAAERAKSPRVSL